MNIQLLEQIKQQILAEPLQFNMYDFFRRHDNEEYRKEHRMPEIPNCGTAACTAGWAIAIVNNENPKQACERVLESQVSPSYTAALHLGMDYHNAKMLFFTCNWPEPFQEDYRQAMVARDFPKCAQIACDRIDHFIKTTL